MEKKYRIKEDCKKFIQIKDREQIYFWSDARSLYYHLDKALYTGMKGDEDRDEPIYVSYTHEMFELIEEKEIFELVLMDEGDNQPTMSMHKMDFEGEHIGWTEKEKDLCEILLNWSQELTSEGLTFALQNYFNVPNAAPTIDNGTKKYTQREMIEIVNDWITNETNLRIRPATESFKEFLKDK